MGKKIRNLLGTLFLITAIIVTQIPVTDVEAVDTASASDFQMDGTTLVKYNGTAQDVSISNYVKKIEAGAFQGNDSVKHITLGDNVESIGNNAFSDCSNLVSVSVPDSVTTIGTAAFSRCPSLKEVSVGTGLESLGNGVFAGDYSLEMVNIDSSNPKFTCDDGAIYNKNGRDNLYQVLAGRKGNSYEMPTTVTQIKPYSFWGNYNLEQVKISSNVSEIPGYAFSNCKNLKNVDIPYSVKNIDMKAFEDCVRLRDITIPPSVSTIHSTAFDGCTKLQIHAEDGSAAKTFADNLVLEDIDVSEYEEAPIPQTEGSVSENSTTEANNSSNSANSGAVDYYHEVTHMNPMDEEEDSSVTGKTRVIGQQAFVLIDNAQATINVGSTGETIGGTPEEPVNQDIVPGTWDAGDGKGGSFPKYAVVNREKIAAQAYYDEPMTSYTIPDGVKRIGEFSFARSGLTQIQIPDGVEEIGYGAFYHCDDLNNVTIPDSVTQIEPYAFEKTPWLTNWKQNVGSDSDFLIVGDGILLAYRGNASEVTIPDNVKQIGAHAFMQNEILTKVVIPDTVSVVDEAAFLDCTNLTTIDGGNGLTEIRDRAFAGCPITGLTIPASVESIGLRAFDGEETSREDSDKIAVFAGEQLPSLSYDTTATKLYREDYRDDAFKGIDVIVVPDKMDNFDGTVLEPEQPGFAGTICKITKEATEEEAGTLQVVCRPESHIVIGNTYTIDGLPYTVENSLDAVTYGERMQYATAASPVASGQESVKKGTVTISVDSNTFADTSLASASMEGIEKDYQLSVADSREAKDEIKKAYQNLYGNKLPDNLVGYDMTLTESDTQIPITSLGKQEMMVTLPFPEGVGADNLHVVCLDADGQLEEVSNRTISVDGTDCLSFTATHFSYYGIYNYSSDDSVSTQVTDGQAVFTSLGKKDASPDTGDNSIHPKWFLAAGLLFASLGMFLFRGGVKRKKVS